MNNKLQYTFVVSCAVCLSLLCIRYVMLPQMWINRQNKAHLEAIKTELTTDAPDSGLKKILIEKKTLLKQKYNTLNENNDNLIDVSFVLHVLITKANAAGIKLIKIQPLTEPTKKNDRSHKVMLELTSSYSSLGLFISSIEALPYRININRVSIASTGNDLLDIHILTTCILSTEK